MTAARSLEITVWAGWIIIAHHADFAVQERIYACSDECADWLKSALRTSIALVNILRCGAPR